MGSAIFASRCLVGGQPFAPLSRIPANTDASVGIKDYARPQEDTYFTYPEWYIVWSYQEKSNFQQSHLPSGYTYFADVAQYWRAYCCATAMVGKHYPFNAGDHLMLMVIGSSFSVEYALKGAYENTIGRLTELSTGVQPSQEDVYAARVAKEYADFVHIRPFYEFSFATSFRGLWTENSLWGPHLIRKWERRFFLTLDYGVEAIYCGLITWATHAVYGVESSDTYASIENASPQVFTANPHVRRVKQMDADAQIVIIPRYQEFTETAQRLALAGVRFRDIAGNGEILLTVLLPTHTTYEVPDSQLLFSAAIPARPEMRRIGVRCDVRLLHKVLLTLGERQWMVEHIYDY